MGREVRKPAVLAQYDYAKTTAIGHLTPTAIVRDIFKGVIGAVPSEKGILFNGTPKMINEAKLVSRAARAERSERAVCDLSGMFRLPRSCAAGKAGGKNKWKTGQARRRYCSCVRNRQKYYKAQITRVIAFFGERYTVKKISGMGTEAAVEKKIEAAIKKY